MQNKIFNPCAAVAVYDGLKQGLLQIKYILIPILWVNGHYKYFTFSVRGLTLNVRI